MLEQFQNILDQQPQPQSHSADDLLFHARELILSTMQKMFPPQHNFQGLSALCDDPRVAGNQALLTYHLVDYFTQLVELNFVSQHGYEALEGQTQKMQATIRSHIRLEQEVKLYLQHLQSKVAKYENYLRRGAQQGFALGKEDIPGPQETELRRERISLIRANERLKREVQEKEEMLRKFASGQGRVQMEERMRGKRRLQAVRSEKGQLGEYSGEEVKEIKDGTGQKMEKDRILINILGNNNQFNYFSQ